MGTKYPNSLLCLLGFSPFGLRLLVCMVSRLMVTGLLTLCSL